jgi:predicted DNA-binding transcriptional regulator AlpA
VSGRSVGQCERNKRLCVTGRQDANELRRGGLFSFFGRPAHHQEGAPCPMSTNLSEIHTAYKRFNLDARTGQIIAVLQTAAVTDIPDDQLITSKQLAALFGVSLQWVEIARHRGEGPKWVAISARCIRYRMVDVIEWLQERGKARAKYEAARKLARMERQTSTAQTQPKQRGRKA